MTRIYLDHNATTPMSPASAALMSELLVDMYGNPSSVHWAGVGALKLVHEARLDVARLIGARRSEIVFTGGGTEADVTAVRNMVLLARRANPDRIPHIIAGATEHHAIINALAQYEEMGIARKTIAAVDSRGQVPLRWLERALADSDGLCLMWANNETGTIPDIEAVGALVEAAGVPWHCDAVQAAGKVPIDVRAAGADQITTLALAAHKLYGPKGIGALFVRHGCEVVPLLPGGGQEGNRRSGTINAPGIAGFAVAAREAKQRLEGSNEAMVRRRDRLETAILERAPGSEINGDVQSRLPNTVNISLNVDGAWGDGEGWMLDFSEQGIAMSTGAACTADQHEPSHVLLAMGLTAEKAHASLRFSVGPETTDAEIDRAIEVLEMLLERGPDDLDRS
jgi:cysteine desulfurase